MSKTAKAALWILLATLFSKILGFFREVVLANFYGTGAYADVFLLTVNIPGLIVAVVGSAVATTYIPLYFEAKERDGEEGTIKFTNNILNISFVLAIIIAILGLIFTEEFVKVFAGGFEGEKFTLAVKFTKIMISGAIFLAGSKIFASYLQVNDSFGIPALIGIPYNIIIIISIMISVNANPDILAIGALIAMASQMFFQIPSSLKKGYRYKPYINMKDESIRNMVVLVLPMLVGVAIGQLNSFVDKALATTLGDGYLSALNYGGKLNDVIMALFVTSIITAIYPKLSKISSGDNRDGFINLIVKSANYIILLVLPIVVGCMILAVPIVRILFERGAFDAQSTMWTATSLKLFSLGLLASAVRDVLYRAFYSMSDTKTPMINGSIALTMNIVFNLILIKPLGYKGIALSTSLSSMLTVVLLLFSLKRKFGYFGGDKILSTTLKSLIASVIMGIVTYFLYKYLNGALGLGTINEIISVGTSVLVGAIVYGIVVIVLKVEEVNLAIDMGKKYKNKLLKRQ
ncbi:murein biosynthesis integral membrane protein MurJ [Romboutsia sp.]|uniref:murein biosynthesis integral membrane protein MurJ n=1 Tax=Romboutsia sp. TaxID=1965302 RepID=UPI003F2DD869